MEVVSRFRKEDFKGKECDIPKVLFWSRQLEQLGQDPILTAVECERVMRGYAALMTFLFPTAEEGKVQAVKLNSRMIYPLTDEKLELYLTRMYAKKRSLTYVYNVFMQAMFFDDKLEDFHTCIFLNEARKYNYDPASMELILSQRKMGQLE